MILDQATGEPQEVDITVECEVAGYKQLVAIECRDRKRVETKTWIEELAGKYGPPVTQVVAVSKSGFSRQAVAKARSRGITLRTLEEAEDEDWARFIKATTITLTIHGLEIHDAIVQWAEPQPDPLPNSHEDVELVVPDDGSIGNIRKLLHDQLNDPEFRRLIETAPKADGLKSIRLSAEGLTGKLPGGRSHAIDGIVFRFEPTEDAFRMPLEPKRFGDKNVAIGTGTDSRFEVQAVVLDNQVAGRSMGLNLHLKPGRVWANTPGTWLGTEQGEHVMVSTGSHDK